MFPLPEQLSSAAKSQWETQLQLFSTFGHTVFDGAEKIIALHLDASKAAIARTTGNAQHLLAAHDAREFLQYSTSQAQPGIESVLAYSRELFGIASSTQAQLLDVAKARLDQSSPAAAAAPASTAAQVEVEAVIDVPAPVFAQEPVPESESEPEPEPASAPAPAAVLAPLAEPEPAAPAPLPLAATLPIAASAPAAIAPAPAKVPASIKATAKAPVASKPAIKQGGPSKAVIQPAAKGKRK